MKKRISIEVELEGAVLATDELQAKKDISQDLRSEVMWVLTHSTSVKVLHPLTFNELDVWYEGDKDYEQEEGEELDMDFYVSVLVDALVPDDTDVDSLEPLLVNLLQDSDVINGDVESVTVTISNEV